MSLQTVNQDDIKISLHDKIKNYFLENLEKIEDNLVQCRECEEIFGDSKLKKDGKEADICCTKDNSIVIIEIKTMCDSRSSSLSTLEQIKGYIEFIKNNEYAKGKVIRGVILAYDNLLAHNISELLKEDIKEYGDITLKTYNWTELVFKK